MTGQPKLYVAYVLSNLLGRSGGLGLFLISELDANRREYLAMGEYKQMGKGRHHLKEVARGKDISASIHIIVSKLAFRHPRGHLGG